MPTRSEQKKKTRMKILDAAEQEICRHGLQKWQTATVAQKAKIAHGTLFVHFPTKEYLLLEILDRKLDRFTQEMHERLQLQDDFADVLSAYLEFLIEEEAFFVALAQELPLLPESLRNKVLFREAMLRSHFFQALKRGMDAGMYCQVNITDFLNLLFGTIQYYLSMKSVFAPQENVIQKMQSRLLTLILQLIQNSGGFHE